MHIIEAEGGHLKITHKGSPIFYAFEEIKTIYPSYKKDNNLGHHVVIEFIDMRPALILRMLNFVSQVTWTNDIPGAIKAANDIAGWKSAVSPSSVLVALTSILNAVRAHQDMEILLVRDTGNGGVIVKQINEYDEQTATWITTYQTISGLAYVPVGPLEYLDAAAALALILSELQAHTTLLTAIEVDTTAIALSNANLDVLLSTRNAEATQILIQGLLTAIDADTSNLNVALNTRASEATLGTMLTLAGFEGRINTLGQKSMAASTPVVLSSNQSAIPITASALPLPAGAAIEATQLIIQALLTTIDADTSNLDVALSTRASQVTAAAILTELQLKADLTETQPVSFGPLPIGTNSIGQVTANAGTNLNTSALALEAGGNLALIKAKTDNIPAQGQALAIASLPVVLPIAQITTLTPQTNALTNAELRAVPVPVSGAVTAIPTGTQDVNVVGNTIGLSTAAKQDLLLAELQLKADLTETQPVSALTLPLPTGASIEATQLLVRTAVEGIKQDTLGILNLDYLQVAKGLVPGVTQVQKDGRNPVVTQITVPEDVWEGSAVYSGFPLTAPEVLSFVSTNAGDTGTLTYAYLATNTSTVWQIATVILNGLTPVLGVSAWRVHTASYSNAALGFNLGTITGRHSVTVANIFFMMQPSTNQTCASVYTIPFGSTGFVKHVSAGVNTVLSVAVQSALWIRETTKSPILCRNNSFSNVHNYVDDTILLKLPALTDITLRITNTTSNTGQIIVGGFDIIQFNTIL